MVPPEYRSNDPAEIARILFPAARRVLLWGDPGMGKSTLAVALAQSLADERPGCCCITADPGLPAFGVPGALALAEWRSGGWHLLDLEALCSLDSARFRLPLVAAVRRLSTGAPQAPLVLDAPGVTRGVAAEELVQGLVDAAAIDHILVLTKGELPPSSLTLLAATGLPIHVLAAAPRARRLSRGERARMRTRAWDTYLEDGPIQELRLANLAVCGTPPPSNEDAAWSGRQVALLDEARRTGVLGEVVRKDGDRLTVRLPAPMGGRFLLVRDAMRGRNGLLATAPRPVSPVRYLGPPDLGPPPEAAAPSGPQPTAHVGIGTAMLMNGAFGDPLLHLRLRQKRRSLLFDLGESLRLPARLAHQVSDLFISHAHLDHIGGFLWFLRSRIGIPAPIRLFGPPGMAEHIAGLLAGVRWDRIGDQGPRFQVTEVHGDRLQDFQLQAGRPGSLSMGERTCPDGILLREPEFSVRAVTLDHGIPVLAFGFEAADRLNARNDRLGDLGLPGGPWLEDLKRQVLACSPGQVLATVSDGLVSLPDGRRLQVEALARDLLQITPGVKLVYATDVADTPANRVRLEELARGAEVFFCEASFAEEEAAQARTTGHLTARACGEIAAAASVRHLVPFHFSRRYEDDPERIYAEVSEAFGRLAAAPLASNDG